jgi:hypothetical protein
MSAPQKPPVKANTSTSIFITWYATSLGSAFTVEQIEARVRLLNPPKVADLNQLVSVWPADLPFEFNGRIDRVQFEDIIARINVFNLRSYVEVNLQNTLPTFQMKMNWFSSIKSSVLQKTPFIYCMFMGLLMS